MVLTKLRLQLIDLLLLGGHDLFALRRLEFLLLDSGLESLHLGSLVLDDLSVLHDLVVLVSNHLPVVVHLLDKLLLEGSHESTEHLVTVGFCVQVRFQFLYFLLQHIMLTIS